MAGEPADHGFRHRDARHLVAYAEDGEAQRGDGNRRRKTEDLSAEVGRYAIILDECADDHQATSQYAGEADAHLVKNDSGEEEHKQEHVDESAGSREEAIVSRGPSQPTLRTGHLEQRLEGRHDIIDEIAHHHSRSYDEEHCPTGYLIVPHILIIQAHPAFEDAPVHFNLKNINYKLLDPTWVTSLSCFS